MSFDETRNQAISEWEALQHSQKPRITVGMATCGRAAGGTAVLEAIDKELSRLSIDAIVTQVGCIGICYAEPLVDIIKPNRPRICYSSVTPEIIPQLIEDYLVNDNPRPDLALGSIGEEVVDGIPKLFELPVFKPQVRIALRNCGHIDPSDIKQYIANDGYSGLVKALGMTPEEVIEEIKKSGLRGRGGAGFPTGTKWEFCRRSPSDEKYIICNADEGDPGAFMDRALLESDPHAVLEGILIGAYAIGATHGYIYCRAEYPLAIERLNRAIAEMKENDLLGDNILGSGFSFDTVIKEGAGAFVCGEETALMNSIEGQRGMPRPRPPFPAQSGLWGKPTNINNVETWGNVSAIMHRGGEWYSGFGTETSKGTKTFALAGKIVRTGLIEVPMGISLSDIIYDIGGGIADNKQYKATQTGGPSGGCLPASLLSIPVDYENLAQAGSIVGSGGMVVADEDTCMVDMARFFLAFVQDESCGKCVPCRVGTRQMLNILERITQGEGRPEDIERLEQLGEVVKSTALCGLGQTAPNPVLTTIRYFRDEYEAHILDHHCPAGNCKSLVAHHSLVDRCLPCLITVAGFEVEGYSNLKEVLSEVDRATIIEEAKSSGCIVDVVRFFMTCAQSESCGKCAPCRLGTTQMLALLEDIASGSGSSAHLDLLVEIGNTVKMTAQCPFGQSVSELLLDTLESSRDEYEAHIREHGCPRGVCKVPISYHTVCPIRLGVPVPEEGVLAGVLT